MIEKHNIIISYIKDQMKSIILFFLFLFIFFIVFAIYQLPMAIFLYASIICVTIAILFIGYDFYSYHAKYNRLKNMEKSILVNLENLPEADTLEEREYQKLIYLFNKDKRKLISSEDKKHKDLIEYYTLWTHQIKTPLAAISLLLQSDNRAFNQELELQFLEVEKYVEMALQYLRIDHMYSDLTLEKYSIQKIIRQAIKSYSKIFIYKGISLDLTDKDLTIVTDEKWLLFVIKQILSNSLKYTNSGEISFAIEEDDLVIKDTGIGISQEDIPRIFEKGFTGYSGRIDEKSTGLGLYLSKRILDNLGHKIEISSEDNSGTEVKIDLSRPKLPIE